MPRCHGICTLSPLDAALTMGCAKSEQHDTSKVLRLPRKMMMEVSKSKCCAARKTVTHLLNLTQKFCPCHTKRFLTRYEACWNVTKCHACHAKRGYATFGTSRSDRSCRTHHRHGHMALTRTVADGCGRLRTVVDGCGRKCNVERTHPQPQTPRVKREPLLRIREKGQPMATKVRYSMV